MDSILFLFVHNGKMPAVKEVLVIEEDDRKEIERILRSRKTAVNIARRAQMLVLAARGLSNRQIALELGVAEHVVGRVRKEYGQQGLAVLEDRPRSGRPRSSRDEQSIQKVVETVCQAPAKGLSRWSARTLARQLNIPWATVNRILRESTCSKSGSHSIPIFSRLRRIQRTTRSVRLC
ncbi:MAG TPA: helix-turn-helix domain-containing protein [Chthoniobacterales bacterium]|jgi:transposase|nr:helix-turn-helix domain-containing protein [Chthoniobacterales bacterium]